MHGHSPVLSTPTALWAAADDSAGEKKSGGKKKRRVRKVETQVRRPGGVVGWSCCCYSHCHAIDAARKALSIAQPCILCPGSVVRGARARRRRQRQQRQQPPPSHLRSSRLVPRSVNVVSVVGLSIYLVLVWFSVVAVGGAGAASVLSPEERGESMWCQW